MVPNKSRRWPLLTLLLPRRVLFSAPAAAWEYSPKTVVGIDLGTTYSRVAVIHGGRSEILATLEGDRAIPSYVAFTDAGERLVGQKAKEYAVINPGNAIYGSKQLIGRRLNDRNVQERLKDWPFHVVEKDNKTAVQVMIGGEVAVFLAEEISGMILHELRLLAESYLGHNVSDALITVPAWFNDAQSWATKAAAATAGLDIVGISREPIVAARAYGLDKRLPVSSSVVVYDLGGGAFDGSLLFIEDEIFDILETSGNEHLGGDNFDRNLAHYAAHLWNAQSGQDCTRNATAMRALIQKSEIAKRLLSSQTAARIEILAFHNEQDLDLTVTRSTFESLNEQLLQTIMPSINTTLLKSYEQTEVDHVVLAGEFARIPRMAELVESHMNGKKALHGISPEEVVAYGAAVVALERGCCSYSYIDPGLDGSYGVEDAGGTVVPMIIYAWQPVLKSHIFTTFTDGQATFRVRLFKSAVWDMKNDNMLIGELNLTGILRAPRGVARINVTVAIDKQDHISVQAADVTPHWTDRWQITRYLRATLLPRVSAHFDIDGHASDFLTEKQLEEQLSRDRLEERAAKENHELKYKLNPRFEFASYTTALIGRVRDLDEFEGRKLQGASRERLLKALANARAWIESRDKYAASIDTIQEQRRLLESVAEPILAWLSAVSVHDEL
ncbi:ATPase with role in protein import into the ER [Geranomyces variabilis]|nr:ATPase with role in protein import into the ER [Geranomyces variabilis]